MLGMLARSVLWRIGGSVFLVEFFRPYALGVALVFDVCCFGSVAAPFCQIFWHRHFIRYFLTLFPLVTGELTGCPLLLVL